LNITVLLERLASNIVSLTPKTSDQEQYSQFFSAIRGALIKIANKNAVIVNFIESPHIKIA
jgi:hypothetical protein